jgi:hypothetical protein
MSLDVVFPIMAIALTVFLMCRWALSNYARSRDADRLVRLPLQMVHVLSGVIAGLGILWIIGIVMLLMRS